MPLALSLCDSNSSVFSTVLKLGFSFPFTVTQTFTSFGYRLVYLLPFPLFPRTFSRDSLPLRLPVFSFFCFNCSPLNAACAFLSFVFVFLTIPQRALSGLPYPTGHPQVTSFFFFFLQFSFLCCWFASKTHSRPHSRAQPHRRTVRHISLRDSVWRVPALFFFPCFVFGNRNGTHYCCPELPGVHSASCTPLYPSFLSPIFCCGVASAIQLPLVRTCVSIRCVFFRL